MTGGGARAGKEWFTPAEIVAARSPELPGTVQNLNRLAVASGWRADPAKARKVGGRGRASWEYHLSVLPAGAQARLALLHAAGPASEAPQRSSAWETFESLSKGHKEEAQRRLDVLLVMEKHKSTGSSETASAAFAARASGVSSATIFNWKRQVRGIARADWLPALAPSWQATAAFAECHPMALEVLKSDWLRPEQPTFSSCYRRMSKAASKNGWLPVPSERALRRRVEAEVPAGVIALARKGKEKAKTLYPAQKRIRSHFHAMQAVNADGHTLDVFVRTEDGRIVRMHLVAMQDLYSGKVVAWRLSETENKETIRLVIGDMVERHGIPQHCWLDNGRGFASKWISGRMATRYRFKIRDEDPQGVLLSLGVEVHWTTPYHGQAKPIERAFRDLADNIAKHPFCAGAYTGNNPMAKPENYGNAAVPLDEFRAHVAREIAEHNARTGRRAEACAGRSFDETFAASLADPATIVRWPTEAQRALWLLAAEALRTKRGSGEIEFYGNRYWRSALNQHSGRKVIVRFDPDRLQDAIKVYTLDDRLICEAACIAPVGYDDVDAARVHARDKNAHLKAVREQLRLQRKMSVDELARIYGAGEKPAQPQPTPPAVKRLAVNSARQMPEPVDQDEFEESFAAGLRLLGADAEIIPFQPKRTEAG
jgi:transposase InsO family protein